MATIGGETGKRYTPLLFAWSAKLRIEKSSAKVRVDFEMASAEIAAEGHFGGPNHVSKESGSWKRCRQTSSSGS